MKLALHQVLGFILFVQQVAELCNGLLQVPVARSRSRSSTFVASRRTPYNARKMSPNLAFLSTSMDNDLSPIAKEDFPLLTNINNNNNQQPFVYLDSAATSQKPQVVIDTMNHFYQTSNANVHRGAYRLANQATELYEQSRSKVQSFLNAKYYEEIIFTRSATEAINLVAYSYANQFLQEGDEIVLTVMEHHSNLIPWQLLAKRKGLQLRFVPLTAETQEFDMQTFRSFFPHSDETSIYSKKDKLRDKVKLVALSHVSNVLGNVNPIKEVIDLAHKNNAVVLLDACQSVPTIPMDVQELDIDFLAASSHKMCGPFGIGFLYGKKHLLEQMPPFQGGGQMINEVSLFESTYAPPPFRFEAGTPAIAEAVGLGRAIDYLTKDIGGMQRIWGHEHALGEYLYHSLLNSNIPGIQIYGSGDMSKRSGIVSFNIDGLHGMDISMLLDQHGICIRNGHHCAKPLHDVLGVSSSMRASVYFYNGKEDIDYFVKKLQDVVSLLKSFCSLKM